ncbi:MAG: antibiotic biosynthesis monooxygenase [Sphingomonas sp.]|nr:antibiotic biosynthesis monooxygenase [Sphingomonas sp.]
MTHMRLWRFDVAAADEQRFLKTYGSDGAWARLFATAPGFIRTELWQSSDGSYLTADHWSSRADFDRFQSGHGEEYRRLDRELEGVAGVETFVGAFDLSS